MLKSAFVQIFILSIFYNDIEIKAFTACLENHKSKS